MLIRVHEPFGGHGVHDMLDLIWKSVKRSVIVPMTRFEPAYLEAILGQLS